MVFCVCIPIILWNKINRSENQIYQLERRGWAKKLPHAHCFSPSQPSIICVLPGDWCKLPPLTNQRRPFACLWTSTAEDPSACRQAPPSPDGISGACRRNCKCCGREKNPNTAATQWSTLKVHLSARTHARFKAKAHKRQQSQTTTKQTGQKTDC